MLRGPTLVAAVIYNLPSDPAAAEAQLREMVAALRSARVLDIAVVSDGRSAARWFSGPIVAAAGEAQPGAGARVFQNVHGILFCPAGETLSQELIVHLLQAFWKSDAPLIPALRGHRTFPLIVRAPLLGELAAAPSIGEFLSRHTLAGFPAVAEGAA